MLLLVTDVGLTFCVSLDYSVVFFQLCWVELSVGLPSLEIGREERLRNYLFCVDCTVKP